MLCDEISCSVCNSFTPSSGIIAVNSCQRFTETFMATLNEVLYDFILTWLRPSDIATFK